MTHSTFTVPLSLILLGLGAAACGHADGNQADPAPTNDGGAGPVLGARHNTGPVHLDLPFADGGQAGDSDDAATAANSAAAAAPARTASPRPDTTPPRVVSVQPANGAVGVTADAKIVIEFSEPMAQQATRDALGSETLLRADTAMSWNETGTILTLEPKTPLTYAHAALTDAADLELQAKTYGYTLTRFATDLAGNALEETTVEFSTLREVTHTLTPMADLTGALRNVSDDAQARSYGFVTFDAGALPSGIVKLERAVAELGRDSLDQPVPVFEITYDKLSNAALSAGPGTGTLVGTLPAGVSGALTIPPEVASFLAHHYLNRTAEDHLAQFRLDLPAALVNVNVDLALVNRALEQTSLVVDYLLP